MGCPSRNGQIMMTYRCSAACRHCLVMAAPKQDAALVSIEDAVQYGLDFQRLGRNVIIAGGEALLFFDHVLAMCSALQAAGVPVAFIESNGSWCTSDERVERRLAQLQAAGVAGMYFSIDGYHQEFVPAESVCRGVRIARQIFGQNKVYASSKTLAEVRELETLTRDPSRLRQAVRAGNVHFVGRAADALAPCALPQPLETLTRQDCRRDLDIDNLQELQVDPFGFVRPDWCPGVNLGNAKRDRIADLALTQRVTTTPLLRDLAAAGPATLLPLAGPFGFTPQPAYASKCHLCFAIRRHLVGHLPDEFGPPQVYAADT